MAKKKNVPPPVEVIREAALQAIRPPSEPVTAKQLVVLLKPRFKLDEAILSPVLDECVSRGELHPIPKATPKGKPRYWDRDLAEYGRGLIVRVLDKQGPLPKAKVKMVAKGLDAATFECAFQTLIDSHAVCEHPPIGRTKLLKYGTHPPAPEAYLNDVAVQLSKVVTQLTAAGVQRDVLRRAVWELVSQSGLSVPTATNPDSPKASDESPSRSIASIDLLLLMRQVEPGAERGALVSSRDLRRVANLDKAEFDRIVLDLARQGRLMLHHHDHASHLSVAERDELVTDGSGKYYVGMALRRVDA